MAIFENKLLKGVKTSIVEADKNGRIWLSIDNQSTGCMTAIDTTTAKLRDYANHLLSVCDAIDLKSNGDSSRFSRGRAETIGVSVKFNKPVGQVAHTLHALADAQAQQAPAQTEERYEPEPEFCGANRDGECHKLGCPQRRDNEPSKSGRSCPRPDHPDD